MTEFILRGVVRLKDDNLAGALSDLDNAIKFDQKFARAYPNRGNVKLSRGDLDGAIADYHRAIDLDPKMTEAYAMRGTYTLSLGDLDSAIAYYTDQSKVSLSFPSLFDAYQ